MSGRRAERVLDGLDEEQLREVMRELFLRLPEKQVLDGVVEWARSTGNVSELAAWLEAEQ